MITIIYGRSGTGKTEKILEQIRNDVANCKKVLLILPEQQLWSMEDKMARLLDPSGYRYLEIVSFSRLARSVFEKVGGLAVPAVTRTAKSMVMWETLAEFSDKTDTSPISFLKRTPKSRLAKMVPPLLDTAEDLRVNGITPDSLDECSTMLEAEDPLRNKLSDLAAVTGMYEEKLTSITNGRPHDPLVRAAEALETHPDLWKNASVYLDSFTLFTAPEMALVRQLAMRASEVTVSLCTDRSDASPAFATVNATYRKLINLADQLGITTNPVLLEKETDLLKDPLGAIESNLWNFSREASELQLKPENLNDTFRVLACPQVYAEAEACALNILKLIQTKEYRYQDIAVIVRDTESWSGILDAALEKYNVPFFLSEKIRLNSHPLARLILSSLRVVDSDFALEDVLTVAKTGLCGICPTDVQTFSEYCETWDIHGKRFRDNQWTMNPDGFTDYLSDRGKKTLQTVNRVRKDLIVPLEELHLGLNGGSTVSEKCQAVVRYLSRMNLKDRLAEMSEAQMKDGRYRESCDTLRIGNAVVEILQTLMDFVTKETVSTGDFISLLSLAFDEADMANVPQTRDCVMVGPASMLRIEKVRVTLILGLNDGEFPKTVTDSKFLTKDEKATLASLSGNTSPSLQEANNMADELFYLYRAVTRPTEKLFLSYHTHQTSGNDGKAAPSLALTRIMHLFPDIHMVRFDPAQLIPKKDEAVDNDPPIVFSQAEPLYLSKSKIDLFVKCPFAYYATYDLNLRDSGLAGIGYNTSGSFIHKVMEEAVSLFVDRVTKEKSLPDPDTFDSKLNDIINKTILLFTDASFLSDGRLMHQFDRLRIIARSMAKNLYEEFSSTQFTPVAFELSIGGKKPGALPYKAFPAENVFFGGTVDRVDLYSNGVKEWLRVVDYKSSEKTVDLAKIPEGENLELFLYLFALCGSNDPLYRSSSGRTVLPASATYLFNKNQDGVLKQARTVILLNDQAFLNVYGNPPVKKYLPGKVTFNQTAGQFGGDNLLPVDKMDELEKTTDNVTLSIARDIRSGQHAKKPSENACEYCLLNSRCALRIKRNN